MVKRKKPTLRRELYKFFYGLRLQVRNRTKLDWGFAFQTTLVIAIDSALVGAWLFAFGHFGVIGTWTWREYIGSYGIAMIMFGLVMFLSFGIMELPRHVMRGSLDNILVRPQSVLAQLASGSFDPTTIVDTLLGAGLFAFYLATTPLSLAKVGVLLVALVVSGVLFWCFGLVLPNLLPFYIRDSQRLSRNARLLILDSSSSPTGVLRGPLRVLFMTLIPGVYLGAVPLQVIESFTWQPVPWGIALTAITLGVTLWLTKVSLRRYTSGNLIGAR